MNTDSMDRPRLVDTEIDDADVAPPPAEACSYLLGDEDPPPPAWRNPWVWVLIGVVVFVGLLAAGAALAAPGGPNSLPLP